MKPHFRMHLPLTRHLRATSLLMTRAFPACVVRKLSARRDRHNFQDRLLDSLTARRNIALSLTIGHVRAQEVLERVESAKLPDGAGQVPL